MALEQVLSKRFSYRKLSKTVSGGSEKFENRQDKRSCTLFCVVQKGLKYSLSVTSSSTIRLRHLGAIQIQWQQYVHVQFYHSYESWLISTLIIFYSIHTKQVKTVTFFLSLISIQTCIYDIIYSCMKSFEFFISRAFCICFKGSMFDWNTYNQNIFTSNNIKLQLM